MGTCFHHNDLDGWCAGAIVARFNRMIHLEEIDYTDRFPREEIGRGDQVWLVDYTPPQDEDIEWLLDNASTIHWCDHHKTAIERVSRLQSRLCASGQTKRYARLGEVLTGISQAADPDGTKTSGALLTWRYVESLMDREPIAPPQAVLLVSDYDTWTFAFGDETKDFQYGAKALGGKPNWALWQALLDGDLDTLVDVLRAGAVVRKYDAQIKGDHCRQFAYPVLFRGYFGVALNTQFFNPSAFEAISADLNPDVEVLLPFCWQGGRHKVSIYRGPKGERDGLDCSELVRGFGGGGHPGAAGFVGAGYPPFTQLPAERLVW